MNRSAQRIPHLLLLLVVCAAIVGLSGTADAALRKPSYGPGDRWVYVLGGTIRTFPGLNESQFGTFRFDLVGRVEVDVIGPADVISAGSPVAAVQVDSRTSGFLNGTFSVPGGGTGRVTGTFTTSTTEFWEDEAYLPIDSNTTSSYRADVTYFITTPLAADFHVHASTSVSTIPPFELDVGQNATAPLDTHVFLNSTVTAFGQTTSTSNETNVSSLSRREVLSRENVTVEAGTFSAYRLNQTLGSFPAIPGGISGGNETAYFSNDVGYYVKRQAYANGTPVAEMTLKSYSFGASPASRLSAVDLLLLIAVPAVLVLLIVVAWRRRRKGRMQAALSEAPSSTNEEAKGGGITRAR